jgi:hypothetical protein
MMMHTVIILIWFHFFADFVMQTDEIAKRKAREPVICVWHAFLYMIPLLCYGAEYALFNGVAHYIVDSITSKLTSWLYAKDQRHWFFVTIGFDQAIHMTTLIASVSLMSGGLHAAYVY